MKPITAKDVANATEGMFVEAFVRAWNAERAERLDVVRRLDPPAPDYLMANEAGEFGLEVTELFQDAARSDGGGSAQRRARGAHAEQLTKLAEAYYAQGGLPVRLNVLLLRDDDVETLAESRHDEIVSRLIGGRAASGASEVEITGKHGAPLARLFLWSISSSDKQFARYSWWECLNDRVGWAGPLQLAVIDQAIQRKASKLASYREATHRVALLLVVNSGWQGGMCWWPEELEVLNTDGFDDVYFYIHGDPRRTDIRRFSGDRNRYGQ